VSAEDGEIVEALISEPGPRLDRTLAAALPAFSRARLQALIAQGAVSRDGEVLDDASAKAPPGLYRVMVPPAVPAVPQGEDVDLTVLFEDAHLIVIDKPAGMSAHPAPGSESGTLVNALIHHCGESLSGIGGVARPGIVHRLDKGTSGVMVAAKTDAAHRGLSALFAAHDLERVYIALTRGAPEPRQGSVETQIGRARFDRQRMAVLQSGGRAAITHYRVKAAWGDETSKGPRVLAALTACTLETGRTHQIRVHMAHKGAPVLGDPLYGSSPPAAKVREAIAEAGLQRQALHAAVLGFVHPISGKALKFESEPPQDMARLRTELEVRLKQF